jgi:hypothetical protein
MCNTLHADSKPIPEKGVGYKVFRVVRLDDDTDEFIPAFAFSKAKYFHKGDWIIFKDRLHETSYEEGLAGFTFFPDLSDAKMLFRFLREDNFILWNYAVALIEYDYGLGSHNEHSLIGSPKIALCRQFKIKEVIYEESKALTEETV